MMPDWNDAFMMSNTIVNDRIIQNSSSSSSSSRTTNIAINNDLSTINQSTQQIISNKDILDYVEYSADQNLSATLQNIRTLLNPENYSPSFKATLTRRTTLIIAFYCSIVIVSLFGNLLVCYVVFKRKRMRISTNLLMTNLALSDLLMTVINIPFNIARILLDEWPFGSILCILVPLVQVTSVYVSTLTMTIIAIDRYQAIINPLHKRITTSLPTLFTILLIWMAAAFFSIPNVVFNRVVEIAGHTNLLRCRAIYPKPELIYRRYVTLFTFLTQYAIPLSITTFAYIRISFYIWSKLTEPKTNDDQEETNEMAVPNRSNDSMENSVPSIIPNKTVSFKNNCYQASINQLRERSRRKSIKMLALVVGVFSICWLPLNIFHLNSDFSSSNRISDPNIFFVCHWFAMSSVCYNPFIYFWLNRHYRQEIKHLIRCTNFLFMANRNQAASSPVMDIMNHNPQLKNNRQPSDKNYPMVCFENVNEFPKNLLNNVTPTKNSSKSYHHYDKSANCTVIFRSRFNIAASSEPANGHHTAPVFNDQPSSSNPLIRSNMSLYFETTARNAG